VLSRDREDLTRAIAGGPANDWPACERLAGLPYGIPARRRLRRV
jgi:hypothetical protein